MAWWATPHALVWWAILIALAVVLGLAIAQIMRAVRELGRFNSRIEGFADLPVVKALPRAEANVARIEAALGQVERLLERANAALAVIRRGPVPPEFVAGIRRVAGEVAAFRAASRR